MELLFVTVQLLSRQRILHLEKILYFSLEICDYVTYATDGSISGHLADYHSTEQIS